LIQNSKGGNSLLNLNRGKTGFAILGVASHHSQYVPSALEKLPGTYLAGVYDEDIDRARRFSAKCGTRVFTHVDALLEDPDVQVVFVTSENTGKRDLSIAAARARKHVICDKPLGITAVQSREIIDACRKEGVQLQVGYISRYVKEVQRARQFVKSGKLGKVKFINIENRVDSGLVKELSPWLMYKKLGVGALLEHSVHAIDLALWFNESRPISIYATSGNNLDASYDSEDNFAIIIRFLNNSIALIDGSYCRASSGRRGDISCKINGTQRELSFSVCNQELRTYMGEEPNIEEKNYSIHGESSEESSCFSMIQDFLRCLENGTVPITTGIIGEKVNIVVDASYSSLLTGEEIPITCG
jgi:myo-inositol 2-dehydrogenase / D-chiro-inositol 1-dehydrogenase